MRGEISAKTTYQRTSKGNVSIKEADPDGKFISVDSRKNIQIGGWAIHRSIDGEKPIIYTFSNRELVFGQLLKIWSSKCRNMATSSDDIVADDVESWGSGTNVVTTIVNDKREEQAKYTQNTLFN